MFIGIDVGTGGVRVLCVTEKGEIVAAASVPLESSAISEEDVRHEQSPQAWWSAAVTAVRKLVSELRNADVSLDALQGLAVDGTSGTVVCLDDKDEPPRPALMYNDGRASAEAESLNDVAIAHCEKHGYRFSASFALAKIIWIREHEPETFRRSRRFVHQADYVAGRLTGEFAVSDYSNALKTGYDLLDERWPEWIERFGGVAEKLPRVVAPGDLVGHISTRAAEKTSLPQGLPVFAGATDGTAACLASGARRPGDYSTTLGTTLVFKGISDRIGKHPEGLVYSHKLPGGLWLPGGASNTGAEWIEAWFGGEDLAALDAQAAAKLPCECVAYPLARKGERFPFRSGEARAFFEPEPGDPVTRYASALQGVALLERLGYDVLDEVTGVGGGVVYSAGGGSRSDVWMQCRADATGKTMCRAESVESAFGSAILAAVGGQFGDIPVAIDSMVRVAKVFAPDERRRSEYDTLYGRFRDELRKRGYL